jgi:hypothetical protein
MVIFLLLRNIYNRSESIFGTVVYWIRFRYRILTGSVADLDPGSCASLTLGSESGIPDLESKP